MMRSDGKCYNINPYEERRPYFCFQLILYLGVAKIDRVVDT
jgi:hypothetical protein